MDEPPVWTPNGTEQLLHTVVENQNGFRFSYDGASPGPTVRMRGDETPSVRLRNDLSEDAGTTPIVPNPDPGEGYRGPRARCSSNSIRRTSTARGSIASPPCRGPTGRSQRRLRVPLGNVMEGLPGPDGQPLRDVPHPPGTQWYHPHSHGATQNQVAAGWRAS